MRPGHRLPAREAQDPRSGRTVRLRDQARGSIVLFVPHGPECEGCRAYLGTLAGLDEACRLWDARRIAVARGDVAGLRPSDPPFPGLADPGGDLVSRLAAPGHASLIVADRFGECFHVDEVGPDDHEGLSTAAEIESWLRFIAIQCPECGVPDTVNPGEWGPPDR